MVDKSGQTDEWPGNLHPERLLLLYIYVKILKAQAARRDQNPLSITLRAQQFFPKNIRCASEV